MATIADPLASKRLREERFKLGQDIKALAKKVNDEKRDFTAEESKQWDKINADYDSYEPRIKRAEQLERLNADSLPEGGERQSQRHPGQDDRRHKKSSIGDRDPLVAEGVRRSQVGGLALHGWVAAQSGLEITARQRSALRVARIRPSQRDFIIRLPERRYMNTPAWCLTSEQRAEQRALSALVGAAGAFTIPEGFVNMLEQQMLYFGPMLQAASIMRTDSGNPLPWPHVNDTSNTGEIVGESASIGSSVDPSFGQTVFSAYKFSSKLVLVPVELTEDANFDIPSLLGELLGERLGRIINTRCTTGTGAAQPTGVVTTATAGVTTGASGAIIVDELYDLQHALDVAYRSRPGVAWMSHDLIVKALRKLQDNEWRKYWEPSLLTSVPDRLLGSPFFTNNDMASALATTNITLLYGDFGNYKIRQVRQIRLRRLVERYADTDQEGFVAFMRLDGNQILPAATMKKMTQV